MILGEDVIINKDVYIKNKDEARIGSHVAIDKGFYCTTKLNIGDYVHISPYVTCIGGNNGAFTSLGFNNIMAGTRIICGSDRFDDSGLFGAMIPKEFKGTQIIKPVVMEMFSNTGTNSVIMPGSILRKGCLLTIGSVLFGDTEEWGVYSGNPAKLVKKINPKTILEFAEKMGY
jgi:acetyltransferase-like isoleucine patch superfamily enzyme